MRIFFVLAACLLVLAIVANFAAKGKYSGASMITAGVKQADGTTAAQEMQSGDRLEALSYVLAASATFSWMASVARNERGRQAVLVVLLAVFAVLLVVIV